MKRIMVAIIAAMVACFMLCSCMAPTIPTVPVSVTTGEAAMKEARKYYRESSCVLYARCIKPHEVKREDGTVYYCDDVLVLQPLVGNANMGSIVHCVSSGLKSGANYLLYLNQNEYGEYTLLTEKPLKVVNDNVIWLDGTVIPLAQLRNDIQEMETVIIAPGETYIYNDMSELVEAADYIFTAKVLSMPGMESATFRYQSMGSTVESDVDASIVSLYIRRVAKGDLERGSIIDVVYTQKPYMNVIDALTHQDHQIDTGDVQRLVKGREYVFFLMDSPSPNQDYLFMVNPVQGAISISGNDLIVLSSNKAAYGKYSTEMILFHAIDNMLKY